jgi:hypothetical protein
MDIKDLYNLVHDDFAWFNEWANPLGKGFVSVSTAFQPRGGIKIVNTDDYDIRPRKSFLEREIKSKEESLERLKERKTNELRWFEEQEKSLLAEIGNLKTQLANKIEKK